MISRAVDAIEKKVLLRYYTFHLNFSFNILTYHRYQFQPIFKFSLPEGHETNMKLIEFTYPIKKYLKQFKRKLFFKSRSYRFKS